MKNRIMIKIICILLMISVFIPYPCRGTEPKNQYDFYMVAGGYYHTIALKNDGTVWCWGRNFSGELGNGTTKDTNVPTQVTSLTDVIFVDGGGCGNPDFPAHSIALKKDGKGEEAASLSGHNLSRDEMVALSFNTLKTITKTGKKTLLQVLIEEGAVNADPNAYRELLP
jgi:alpha-tubulin suppressor-like RCC1 family protein